MSGIKVAVIGGSGIYKLDAIKIKNQIKVHTPFGDTSAEIMEAEVDGSSFYFLPRHGHGHHYTPSEVNYRANIYALKKLGVDTVVSISAVGSLQQEYAPRDFVIVDQFIDWTKGVRKRTFFDQGIVGHVSTANPVEGTLRERLYQASKKAGINTHNGGTYICIEGPQFSTKAESNIYRGFGATVIGMTNVPEAFLAKEAGMAYATVAMVTDYDCWKEEHCSVQEIMEVMKSNYVSAQKFVLEAIPDLVRNPVKFEAENKYAVMTDPALHKTSHKEILEVILK
ncbi:MAG TPA: S-methyl-5'-thioadenosine phosphorylase [Bacteriovoracaceae bacterium]|nr:S-methyl-5'-thioadenosine phosphorylase [Bacteriovoracaceae bacterium]